MSFLMATNVVASRPPERRPTLTVRAHANFVQDREPWYPLVWRPRRDPDFRPSLDQELVY